MNAVESNPVEKKLLIYIPCHSDYSEALEQARFIRNEFENINQEQNEFPIKIHIHISINGIDLPLEKINEVNAITQSYTYTPKNIGADANIAKGFELGIEAEYSSLWILSANEKIKSGGIELIVQGISQSNGCHILLIGNQENFVVSNLSNPLEESLQGRPLGLISAVIFNSELCREQYPQATEFFHTGWGQLSVLVQIQIKARQLKSLNLDSSMIYTLDVRENFGQAREYERIGRTYARSFFGFPVLAMTLFPPPNRTGKAILRKWLLTNLHLFAYFNSFVTGKEAIEVRDSFKEILQASGKINRLLVTLANNSFVLRIFKSIKGGK
jgi:hypothetical protein